jgi:hypothetical protein
MMEKKEAKKKKGLGVTKASVRKHIRRSRKAMWLLK